MDVFLLVVKYIILPLKLLMQWAHLAHTRTNLTYRDLGRNVASYKYLLDEDAIHFVQIWSGEDTNITSMIPRLLFLSMCVLAAATLDISYTLLFLICGICIYFAVATYNKVIVRKNILTLEAVIKKVTAYMMLYKDMQRFIKDQQELKRKVPKSFVVVDEYLRRTCSITFNCFKNMILLMEKPDFMPCNTESDIQQTIFNSLTAFKDANTEEELIEKMDLQFNVLVLTTSSFMICLTRAIRNCCYASNERLAIHLTPLLRILNVAYEKQQANFVKLQCPVIDTEQVRRARHPLFTPLLKFMGSIENVHTITRSTFNNLQELDEKINEREMLQVFKTLQSELNAAKEHLYICSLLLNRGKAEPEETKTLKVRKMEARSEPILTIRHDREPDAAQEEEYELLLDSTDIFRELNEEMRDEEEVQVPSSLMRELKQCLYERLINKGKQPLVTPDDDVSPVTSPSESICSEISSELKRMNESLLSEDADVLHAGPSGISTNLPPPPPPPMPTARVFIEPIIVPMRLPDPLPRNVPEEIFGDSDNSSEEGPLEDSEEDSS